MAGEDFNMAMINRSLRTIKAELEFLTDAGAMSPTEYAEILGQLPKQTALKAPLDNSIQNINKLSVQSSQPRAQSPANGYQSYNEKQQRHQPPPSQSPQPDPPPYPAATSATQAPLCYATALYAYNASDPGDLALQPNERIAVTEYMNAEWWKGHSEKTGQEGIFPRSYVRTDEKIPQASSSNPASYGNVPMQVAQGNNTNTAAANSGEPNKGADMGKKFGKKLGNAAIFGAGATIGSNIVNGIF